MMRQSEFKMKFDPELGHFTKQHIYGEGVRSFIKNKLSKKKSPAPAGSSAPAGSIDKKLVAEAAALKVQQKNKKAGDEIAKLLSKEKHQSGQQSGQQLKAPVRTAVKKVTFKEPPKRMTRQQINNRVNQIMTWGRGGAAAAKLYNY